MKSQIPFIPSGLLIVNVDSLSLSKSAPFIYNLNIRKILNAFRNVQFIDEVVKAEKSHHHFPNCVQECGTITLWALYKFKHSYSLLFKGDSWGNLQACFHLKELNALRTQNSSCKSMRSYFFQTISLDFATLVRS